MCVIQQKLNSLLLLRPLSLACLTFMSFQVIFKWFHLPLTSGQPCVICGGENGTSGCYLAVFCVDVALAYHFVAPYTLPTLPPYGSASDIGYTSKNYLKWWAI